MRVELYGCPFYGQKLHLERGRTSQRTSSSLGGVISYTASPSTDKDKTYDGQCCLCVSTVDVIGIISGEIGKLVDGVISGDDDDFWLGWNKSPVSIEFHFDLSRQFRTIRIYTLNNKYHSVQVQFDGTLAIKHQPSPLVSSTPTLFIDTIDLSKYDMTFIAQRVQITFEFTDELFLLTEIQFDNEPSIALNQTSTMNITTNCPLGKSHRSCLTRRRRTTEFMSLVLPFSYTEQFNIGIVPLAHLHVPMVDRVHRRSRLIRFHSLAGHGIMPASSSSSAPSSFASKQ